MTGCTNERKENQTAYRQIGINAMENGDYAGAVDAFNSALGQCIGKITENELDICYYKAAAQYAGGDSAGAVDTYTAIIDYDKKAADAYYLRGCVYLKQGNTEGAVSDFDEAVKNNSSDYELYVNIYENLSAYDMTEKGEEYLHTMLTEVDPKSALQIHTNNIKRTIRALEFYHQTGMKISEHNEAEREKESPYQYAYFVLTDDRAKLYERIDRRVDLMMKSGLEEEVRFLKDRGVSSTSTAMQGLGYKELYAYMNGEYSLEEAVRIIKRDTRHFAKRQLTWFKREKDVTWIDRAVIGDDEEHILDFMIEELRKKQILV